MTQIELPQISFARYLDLLRRRRWQVIPVSLLGLIAGALIAFFVPRYYVVSTTVRMNGNVLGKQGGSENDPMLGVFEAAKVSLPAMVDDALQALRWREVMSGDFDARIAFENAVRSRVEVQDITPGSTRGRDFVVTLISYRDTDGRRALEFIQKLVEMWRESERERLVASLNRENEELLRRYHELGLARDKAEQDLRLHEELHRLNPEDSAARTPSGDSARTSRLRQAEANLAGLRVQRSTLQARRDFLTESRDSTPRRIQQTHTDAQDPVLAAEVNRLTALLMRAEDHVANTTVDHPQHEAALRRRDVLREQVRMINEQLRRTQVEETDNPAYARLNEERESVLQDLAGVEFGIAELQAEVERLTEEAAKLPAIYQTWRGLRDNYDQARAAMLSLESERAKYDARLREVRSEGGYDVLHEPYLPARPTEPNITLVALAGSVVGLGLAIALILLLDALRSTFKTLDDVQRGLPVPVLGSMRFLETAEERYAARASRRRVIVVTAILVVLMVVVVTLYYVAPTRLPGPVWSVLDLLLGGGK